MADQTYVLVTVETRGKVRNDSSRFVGFGVHMIHLDWDALEIEGDAKVVNGKIDEVRVAIDTLRAQGCKDLGLFEQARMRLNDLYGALTEEHEDDEDDFCEQCGAYPEHECDCEDNYPDDDDDVVELGPEADATENDVITLGPKAEPIEILPGVIQVPVDEHLGETLHNLLGG